MYYFGRSAESLQIRRNVLIVTDGTVVAILRRAAGKPIMVRTRERIEVTLFPPKTNLLHVAQRIALPRKARQLSKWSVEELAPWYWTRALDSMTSDKCR